MGFSKYARTRGDGWDVVVSQDRLFIVELATGARLADFKLTPELRKTLQKALADGDPANEKSAPKKKSEKKKSA